MSVPLTLHQYLDSERISIYYLFIKINYLNLLFEGRTSKCVATFLRSFDKNIWTTNNVTMSNDTEQALCDLFNPYVLHIDPNSQLIVVKNLQRER